MKNWIQTPCIGICSTVYGGDVCRGCKRFADEVVEWNGFDSDRKRAILDRLARFTEMAIKDKVESLEVEQLKEALFHYHVRYYAEHSPYSWVYALLRSAADKITDPIQVGIQFKPSFKHVDLNALLHQIDDEIYFLSENAHAELKK